MNKEPSEIDTALYRLLETMIEELKIYEILDWLTKALNKLT